MNGYVARKQSAQSDNALCDRLKAKFNNRGAAAILGRNVPTSEIMRKIQTGVNPFDTAERAAIRLNTDAKGIRYSEAQTRQASVARANAYQAATAQPRAAVRNDKTYAAADARVVRPSMRKSVAHAAKIDERRKAALKEYVMDNNVNPAYNGTYAVAYSRAAEIRTKAALAVKDKEKLNRLVASNGKSRNISRKERAFERTAPVEVKAKAAPFPIELVSLLVICTLAIMLVVYTIAQIYSFSREISDLRDRQEELNKTEQSLMLDLSERDDIRVIEQIAVDEIGMVKNDAVEKNHISLSTNDRIEIQEEDASRDGGFFSTLLSAISSKFSEYFK